MRVYKRPDSQYWWVEFIHKGVHVQESTRTTRKAEAQAYADNRKAEVIKGMAPAKRDKFDFGDLAQLIRDDYLMNERRTLTTTECNIRTLERFFDGWLASEITSHAVEQYKSARLKEGKARAAVNRELKTLNRMFKLALKQELISRMPAVHQLDNADNPRTGFATKEEFYEIYRYLPDWFKGPAELMVVLGWRYGAVRGLERRDYDPKTHTLTQRAALAKNKTLISLVLPPGRLRNVVETALADARLDCPQLFHENGRPILEKRGRDVWYAACDEAGRPRLYLHDLRRSAVKNMGKAGTPSRVAMLVAGFKTLTIFNRYWVVDETEKTNVLESVDRYLDDAKDERVVVPMRRKS